MKSFDIKVIFIFDIEVQTNQTFNIESVFHIEVSNVDVGLRYRSLEFRHWGGDTGKDPDVGAGAGAGASAGAGPSGAGAEDKLPGTAKPTKT